MLAAVADNGTAPKFLSALILKVPSDIVVKDKTALVPFTVMPPIEIALLIP
jgi:hypothetical protein